MKKQSLDLIRMAGFRFLAKEGREKLSLLSSWGRSTLHRQQVGPVKSMTGTPTGEIAALSMFSLVSVNQLYSQPRGNG